jgi:hypothetical protein
MKLILYTIDPGVAQRGIKLRADPLEKGPLIKK